MAMYIQEMTRMLALAPRRGADRAFAAPVLARSEMTA